MAQQSITLQTSDADVVSGDVLGRVNFAASNESSGSEAKWIGASVYAEASGEFTATVNPTNLVFATSDADGVTARYKVTNVGHLIPNVTSTYNIGSSALKINNIFSATGTLDRVATTGIQLTGSASQSGLLYINNSNLISSSPNVLFSNADLASPKLIFKASGTTTPDLSLNILTTASGTTSGVQTLSIQGSAGELFSITDVLDSGTIFSVNDISGLSLIEADASGVVTLVRYGTNVAVGDLTPTQKLHVGGNLRVSGAYYDSLNSPGTSGQVLVSTAVGTDWKTLSEIVGVDGVGISGYTARWIDAETISSGIIYDNGTNIGIGTTSPSYKFHLANGAFYSAGDASAVAYYMQAHQAIRVASATLTDITYFDSPIINFRNPANSFTTQMFLNSSGLAVGNVTSALARLYVNTQTATTTGVIVRGAASQSADLQQWQDSAGTALVRIDSAGSISGVASGIFMQRVGIGLSNPTTSLQVALPLSTTNYIFKSPSGDNLLALQTFPTSDRMQLLLGSYNGTATPTLASIADPNTGLQFPGSDVLRFVNNGVETVSIIANGSVGIGTNDPTYRFDLRGTGWVSGLFHVGSPFIGTTLGAGATYEGYIGGHNSLIFSTNQLNVGLAAGEKMRLTAAGYFGINTNSPTAQLQINTSGINATGVIVRGSASQSADLQQWQNSAGVALVRVDSAGSISGVASGIFMGRVGIANASPQNLLTIGSGIGTGLNVNSTAGYGLGIHHSGIIVISPETAANGPTYNLLNLTISKPGNYWGGQATIDFNVRDRGNDYPSRTSARITGGDANGDVGRGIISFATALNSGVAPTTAMTITNSGDVGIGVTNPSVKLEIGGDLNVGYANENVNRQIVIHSSNVSNKVGIIQHDGSSLNISYNIANQSLNLGTSAIRWGNGVNYYGGSHSFYGTVGASPIATISAVTSGVGINTTSPTARLHVETNAATATGVIVRGAASQTADLLQVQNSAGTTLLDIDAAGSLSGVGSGIFMERLGVGISSPATIVHALGVNPSLRLQGTTTTPTTSLSMANTGGDLGGISWNMSTGEFKIGNTGGNGHYMTFYTGTGTEKVRIDTNGNVGIGIASPTQRLHVSGNMRLTGAFFDSLNVPGVSGQVLVSTSGGVEWRTSSGGIDGTGSANYLARWIDADTLGTGIVYDNGTNVGIGTASPTQKLDINGSLITNASVYVSGNNRIAQIYNDGNLKIDAVGGYTRILTNFMVDGNVYLNDGDTYGLNASTNSLRFFAYDSSTHGNIQFFSNNSVERVRIDSSGNLGIGTTAPSGKLHIETGAAATTGIIVRGATSQTADFQQWQNSAGTMLASVTKDGNISYNTSSSLGLVWGTASLLFNGQNEGVQIRPYTGSYVGFSVKGQTAQSYDLTQWKDSTGTVLARIDAAGSISGVASGIFMGRVGVGTSNPTTPLEVNGTVTVNSYTTGYYEGYRAIWLQSTHRNIAGTAFQIANITNQGLTFGSAASQHMVLTSGDGNLGIGTLSPTQKLDVRGSAFISGALYDSTNSAGTNGQVLTSTATGTDWKSLSEIVGVDGVGTSGYVARWIDTDTIGTGLIYDNGVGVGIGTTTTNHALVVNGNINLHNGGYITWRNGDMLIGRAVNGTGYDMYFQTYTGSSLTEKARITKDGDFGIGTSSPAHRLDVRGTGYFSESVRTSGTVVFASGNTGTVGVMQWNDGEGTVQLGLKGGNVNVELAQDNVVLCYNGVGSSLSKGQVVYASGAQGQRPSVNLALATSDLTSARTIGLVDETIGVGAEGFVVTFGVVTNLNTSALTAGSGLWLSATTPGAITMTRPVAPNHGVFLGWCLNSHVSAGRIFVNVQNGAEIEELHDVLIQNVASGDVLQYDSSNLTWRNRTRSQAGLVEGVGVSGYVPRWTGTNLISSGLIYDNNTNVGVGTSSPSYRLHIVGGSMYLDHNHVFYTSDIRGTSGLNLNTGTSANVFIANGGGNVGVGTTSPTAKLHIETGSGTTSGILVRGAFGQTADYLRVQDSSSGNVMRLANNAELYLGAGSGVTITAGLIKIGEDPSASAGGKFFVIYNTYSNINSYERLNIGWRAAPYDTNVAYISTENSLGGTIRDIAITHDDYTAVGADTMRFKAATQFVGVCNESPTARLHINAASSTVTGVIIQGAASQSAELFRVQDSAANALVRVDAAGSLSGVGSGVFMQRVGAGTSTPTAQLPVNAITATTTGVIVRGASAQTADLFQVQNSAGTALVRVDAAGSVSGVASGLFNYIGLNNPAKSATRFDILETGVKNSVSYISLIRDASTVDNIAANSIGYSYIPQNLNHNYSGVFTGFRYDNVANCSGQIGLYNNLGYSRYNYGTLTSIENVAVTGYGSYVDFLNDANAATLSKAVGYGMNWTGDNGAWSNNPNIIGVELNINDVLNEYATIYGLKADIAVGMNSVGYGFYITGGDFSYLQHSLGLGRTIPSAKLDLVTNSNNEIGIITRGSAAQTADLQQWLNSASGVLLRVDAAGSISGVASGIFDQNLRVANIPAGSSETDVVLVKTDGTFVKRPSSSLGVGGGSGISNEDSIINALIFG